MQQIRRAANKIKSVFYSLFSRPDPIIKIKEEFKDIDQMTQDFQELDFKLDQLHLDELKSSQDQPTKQSTTSTQSEDYQLVIERTYSIMTKKQREFYRLINEQQYQGVLQALKTGKYSRLKQGTWLNDEVLFKDIKIINDFIKQLPLNESTVILNSFQFELLIKADDNKFTRIIQKAKVTNNTQFIIAPFNSNNTHWFTFAIDLVQMTITIYDSMTKKYYNQLFNQLICLSKKIKEGEYKTVIGSCPQQSNMYDCGVFTLKNISILSRYPNANLNNYYDQSTIFYDRIQICLQLISLQ